jgi:hypothetical protein
VLGPRTAAPGGGRENTPPPKRYALNPGGRPKGTVQGVRKMKRHSHRSLTVVVLPVWLAVPPSVVGKVSFKLRQ